MYYVISIGSGVLLGGLAGLLKYLFLWRPLITEKRAMSGKNMLATQLISMAVNVAVLLAIFFLRHLWPYSFEFTIVAAAIALAAMAHLSPFYGRKKAQLLAQEMPSDPAVAAPTVGPVQQAAADAVAAAADAADKNS